MAKTALTVRMSITGLRPTLRALKELPKEANDRLREETLKLADTLAVKVRADGMADAAPQSKLVATTVKAVRDRVPVVQAGGSTRLGRHRAPAYGLLFASVFGMNARSGWYAKRRYRTSHGHQYREHLGQHAYWFFPVVEAEQSTISAAWRKVADQIVHDFSEGG